MRSSRRVQVASTSASAPVRRTGSTDGPRATPTARSRRGSPERVAGPRRHDHDDRASGSSPKSLGDTGPQQRGLADAARAVEHGQAVGHQVRDDHLDLALSAEEEERVERGVVERCQALERASAAPRAPDRSRGRLDEVEPDVPAPAPRRTRSNGSSSTSTSRRRQNSRSSGLASAWTAHDRYAERLVAPEPVEQEAQVPVGHPVPEEEEMAAPQLRGEPDGNDAADLALAEVRRCSRPR